MLRPTSRLSGYDSTPVRLGTKRGQTHQGHERQLHARGGWAGSAR